MTVKNADQVMYRNGSEGAKTAIYTSNNFMNLAGELLICQKNYKSKKKEKDWPKGKLNNSNISMNVCL